MSLIRWYPLNGNCNEKLNSIKNGTPTNVTYSIGKTTPQAAVFTSTSQIILPDWQTSSFSFSYWAMPTETQTATWPDPFQMINVRSRFTPNLSSISFFIYDGTAWRDVGTGPYTLNTWYNIICIYNHQDRYIKMFVNGVPYIRPSTTWINSGSLSTLSICPVDSIVAGTTYFLGKVCDVKIFDHALSDKEALNISKGMVANYSLNNSLNDSTYNSPELINNGAVFSSDSPVNSGSYIFNGTTSRLSLSSYSMLSGSVATITCWIKPGTQANDNYNGIVSILPATVDHGTSLLLSMAADRHITMGTSYNDFTSTGLIPPLNVWSFIAVKVNGTTATVYLNNQKVVGTLSSSLSMNINSTTFSIGCSDVSARFFNGSICDVKIFSTELSDSDIEDIRVQKGSLDNCGNLYISENVETHDVSTTSLSISNKSISSNVFSEVGPVDGLVGYWPFKDDLKDYSGFNNHFSPSIGIVAYSGYIGTRQTLKLNNTTDLTCATSNLISPSFSWCGWVNLSDISIMHAFFDKHIDETHMWRIFYSGSKFEFDYSLGEIGNIQSLANPTVNTLYFLTAQFDSTTNTISFFVNGVLQNSVVVSGVTNTTCTQLVISRYTLANYTKASISNYRYYNRVLTSQEINIIYDLENPSSKVNLKALASNNIPNIYLRNELKETMF